MTALERVLKAFQQAALTPREKGTYFEELILCYLRHEASYRDLYSDVWTYAEWAAQQGISKRDDGIDLVAKTRGTDEFHAIQCKFYSAAHVIQKADIDSFFTASGKKPFKHRLIVATTSHWSEPARAALVGQQPPVSKIDLLDLENSQIDWSRYQTKQAPVLKAKKALRPHQIAAHGAVVATEPLRLAQELAKRHDAHHMSVVFSTYHSIAVISEAQQKHGLADFDLVVCDEAHRTTGYTFDDEEESAFVR